MVMASLGDIKASVPLAESQVQLALANTKSDLSTQASMNQLGVLAGQTAITKAISDAIASSLASQNNINTNILTTAATTAIPDSGPIGCTSWQPGERYSSRSPNPVER